MAKSTDAPRDPKTYVAASDVHLPSAGGYFKAGDPFTTDAEPNEDWTPVETPGAVAADGDAEVQN